MVRSPSRLAVRMTRQAISPRLAMRTDANMRGALRLPLRSRRGITTSSIGADYCWRGGLDEPAAAGGAIDVGCWAGCAAGRGAAERPAGVAACAGGRRAAG